MNNDQIIKELKEYQIEEKLSANESIGYTGMADRKNWVEINQLINGEVIPTFIYLLDDNSLTNKKVKDTIEMFFDYITIRKTYDSLDTEDKEELDNVLMKILSIIKKEHIPLH